MLINSRYDVRTIKLKENSNLEIYNCQIQIFHEEKNNNQNIKNIKKKLLKLNYLI